MRVFIAGATGDLGRPLVRQLIAQKHEVFGLTRSPAKYQQLEDLGAAVVVADVFDAASLEKELRRIAPTHVFHLLTALPKQAPLRPSDFTKTNRLRELGTANLLRAAIAAKAKRILGESFIGVYGYGGGESPNIETDPLREGERWPWLQKIVNALRSLEDQLFLANRQGLIEAIPLRYGLLYGAGIASTQAIFRTLQRRVMPILRDPQGVASFIHSEDATSATLAAMEVGQPGTAYNVVDEEPASMNEFIRYAAVVSGAAPPWELPVWLLRLIVPAVPAIFSARLSASNGKAKRELGWTPRFPTYREGLQEAMAEERK